MIENNRESWGMEMRQFCMCRSQATSYVKQKSRNDHLKRRKRNLSSDQKLVSRRNDHLKRRKRNLTSDQKLVSRTKDCKWAHVETMRTNITGGCQA